MTIRKARSQDISQLVSIDKAAYGDYGADESYFKQKLASPNTWILVVEEKEKITGFAVIELMKKDQIPADFVDLRLDYPIPNNWLHIIAFTTKTNYIDVDSDSKLVIACEEIAKNIGCNISCVPLSIAHPFANHNVFGFWEKNGYKNAGTIKWVASQKEKIDCYFYKKIL